MDNPTVKRVDKYEWDTRRGRIRKKRIKRGRREIMKSEYVWVYSTAASAPQKVLGNLAR